MKDDMKKGLAAIIISKMKPKSEEEDMPSKDEDSSGLESAMEDFKNALEKDDVKAMAVAMKHFLSMCDDDEDEEGEEPSEE